MTHSMCLMLTLKFLYISRLKQNMQCVLTKFSSLSVSVRVSMEGMIGLIILMRRFLCYVRNICIWPMFVNICCRARASAYGACVHACVNSDTCKKVHHSCTYFYCHAAAAFWLINLKGGKEGLYQDGRHFVKEESSRRKPQPLRCTAFSVGGCGEPN